MQLVYMLGNTMFTAVKYIDDLLKTCWNRKDFDLCIDLYLGYPMEKLLASKFILKCIFRNLQ